VTITVVKGM